MDNLWWPAILARLASASCSTHSLNVSKSYFRNRKVMVRNKMKEYTRKMEKGCPQISIIGPVAWVWCMDAILIDLRRNVPSECAHFIAYADDLAWAVKCNTRSELFTHSEQIMEILMVWCNSYRLKISDSKTVSIMFERNLDKSRLAMIKINGKNIKFAEKVKYLGVILDKKLNFIEHAKYLRAKITQHVCVIGRIASERWGIKRHDRKCSMALLRSQL